MVGFRNVCAFTLMVSVGLVAGYAEAGSTDLPMFQEFTFQLNPVLEDNVLPINVEDYDLVLAGDDTKTFSMFNPELGKLCKVVLEVQMNLNGEIFIVRNGINPGITETNAEIGDGLQVFALGKAESGPLVAPIDFGPYNVGVDGAIIGDNYFVDISGNGMDMSELLADLDFFTGLGDVDVDIAACLMINYFGELIGIPGGDSPTNAASGTANGIFANGQVGLTYIYDPASGGGGTVIPSPLALPAGLLLLGGLAIARRRAA